MKFEFAPFHDKICQMILTPETCAEGHQLGWLSTRLRALGVEYAWECVPSSQNQRPFDQVNALRIFTTAELPPQPG